MDRIDTGMTPSTPPPQHPAGGAGVGPRVKLVNGDTFKVWSGVPGHVEATLQARTPDSTQHASTSGPAPSGTTTFGPGAYSQPSAQLSAQPSPRSSQGLTASPRASGAADSFHFSSVLAKHASDSVATKATAQVRSPDSLSRAATAATSSIEGSLSAALSNITALIGAKVTQAVSFEAAPASTSIGSRALGQNTQADSFNDPQSLSQTVPLYRHPADRNTAATAIHAGRILDVNG